MDRMQRTERGPRHNEPAFYSPVGARLETIEQLLRSTCLFLFEGGVWVWPAVEVGYSRQLRGLHGLTERVVNLTTLSLFPRVLLASDFLTEQEAQLIIDRADGHMFKSGVSLKAKDQGKASSEYRTSSQWSFPLYDEGILSLDLRVQQLTRIPMHHAEQIQVLRYHEHEHYTAHHDFFDPG